IQQADTVGCFQIESRAQMQTILRTRPENLDDITIQVALVRPGPIQGKAVHPFIERRQKLRDDPSYEAPADHPLLQAPLRETLGVIVFQDQVLDVAIHLAGFTVGEAEGLRRAMSRKRSHAALEAYRNRFIEGAIGKGVDEQLAHVVYDKLVAFSGFGFPKSHAAAFGLLAYQSAWLRHHYSAEFLASLLNAQPMGFYPPATLVRDGQRRGVETRPPDVNRSGAACTIEDLGVRVGLGYVQGVGEDDAEAVVAERDRGGPFVSIRDLAQRAALSHDEPLRRRAPARAAAPAPAARDAVERRAPRAVGSRPGPGGGDGRRPPAAGDRERRRLHAARGRARADEPDRAAAGVRPLPRRRPQRAAAARARTVRALGPQPQPARDGARQPRHARPRADRRRRRPRLPSGSPSLWPPLSTSD